VHLNARNTVFGFYRSLDNAVTIAARKPNPEEMTLDLTYQKSAGLALEFLT
jgi:hypothetical protein